MRNYLEEIQELEYQLNELTKRIDILQTKGNLLQDALVHKRVLPGIDGYVSRIEAIAIHDTYLDISRHVDELDVERRRIGKQINLLKTEYRKLHSSEFYRPMDEIDISNLIQKDGCIVAVKF